MQKCFALHATLCYSLFARIKLMVFKFINIVVTVKQCWALSLLQVANISMNTTVKGIFSV